MAEHNARLNKLVANFGDIEARRKLIAEFGNSDSAFMGENQDGEDIMISIAQTGIIEKVWQRNGKLRVVLKTLMPWRSLAILSFKASISSCVDVKL